MERASVPVQSAENEACPSWAAASADSIVIGAFEGSEAVGFYTAAYALVTGVQIVPWILSVAVFPVFSRTFRQDHEQLHATCVASAVSGCHGF